MAHTKPPPPHLAIPPSYDEASMLKSVMSHLKIKSPYRKYPPYGVPCPEGINTYQLSLRRENWWQMLKEHALREQTMLENWTIADEGEKQRERHEQEQEKDVEERNREVDDEQRKQRKDSLVVGGDDDMAAADAKEGVGNGDASAICDSSSEEEDDEEQTETGQTKAVKATRTKSAGTNKGNGYKHERKIRRVKALGCVRNHARKGSGASCTSSRTSTSHSEVDIKEAC